MIILLRRENNREGKLNMVMRREIWLWEGKLNMVNWELNWKYIYIERFLREKWLEIEFMSFQHNLIILGVSLHPCSTVLVLKNSEC